MSHRVAPLQILGPVLLCAALVGGGWSVWAATEKTATKDTTLTELEADHIRHTLERLRANQAQILAALSDVEAELSVVKVRVRR